MELIDVLFTICWLFSLALFFLLGFFVAQQQAQKAKFIMMNEGKKIISNLIGGLKENGQSRSIHGSGSGHEPEEEQPELKIANYRPFDDGDICGIGAELEKADK